MDLWLAEKPQTVADPAPLLWPDPAAAHNGLAASRSSFFAADLELHLMVHWIHCPENLSEFLGRRLDPPQFFAQFLGVVGKTEEELFQLFLVQHLFQIDACLLPELGDFHRAQRLPSKIAPERNSVAALLGPGAKLLNLIVYFRGQAA